MTDRHRVEEFLEQLRTKLDLYKLIIEQRHKNKETMLKLELSEYSCREYIKKLTFRNYSEGPVQDTDHGGHYMVFGKIIKNHLIIH